MAVLKIEFSPDDLKLADVSPIFKKEILKKKIIDRLAYYHTCQKSLKGFFINKLILSWLQSFLLVYVVLEKNHNAQYSLLKMIETCKKNLDKRENIGVIIMDTSKDFDTINHSLLLAKLDACGFSRATLNLMQNYLCSKQQRISINGSFIKSSIVGPLLFSIFLNDIFMFISKRNFCNYADDNTLHFDEKDLNRIRKTLKVMLWFCTNSFMRTTSLNPVKCHYMVVGSRDLSHEIMLNNSKITGANEQKLLGIFLDRKLNFESHIVSLCRKAG